MTRTAIRATAEEGDERGGAFRIRVADAAEVAALVCCNRGRLAGTTDSRAGAQYTVPLSTELPAAGGAARSTDRRGVLTSNPPFMAETTPVATTATPLPSTDADRAGVQVHPRAVRRRGRRRRRRRSHPAPRTAGRSTLRWRRSRPGSRSRRSPGGGTSRCCSGSSGCSSEDEPTLVDGTVLSAHQVDALSGTLTALLAEAQRNGNGNGNGAVAEDELAARAGRHPGRGGADDEDEPEEPMDWDESGAADDDVQLPEAPEDPNAAQALLVRARDRRRQDRRRARLRRGVAHRRRPDPHPPPQPRRPVPRRAARPRLRQADLAGAAQGPGPRATAR